MVARDDASDNSEELFERPAFSSMIRTARAHSLNAADTMFSYSASNISLFIEESVRHLSPVYMLLLQFLSYVVFLLKPCRISLKDNNV